MARKYIQGRPRLRMAGRNRYLPFYELRAAAVDLRPNGSGFDKAKTTARIRAMLDTLRDHRVRHVVLSAFGCGAFTNPCTEVAEIFRNELERRKPASIFASSLNAHYHECAHAVPVYVRLLPTRRTKLALKNPGSCRSLDGRRNHGLDIPRTVDFQSIG